MLEVMEFIFSSFWVWLGTVILVATVSETFRGLVRVVIHKGK